MRQGSSVQEKKPAYALSKSRLLYRFGNAYQWAKSSVSLCVVKARLRMSELGVLRLQ